MHLIEINFRPSGAAIGETGLELEQDIILVLLYQAPRLVPAARPRAKPDPTPTGPRPDAQRPTRCPAPDPTGHKKGRPEGRPVARKFARLSHDLIRDHLATFHGLRVIPF